MGSATLWCETSWGDESLSLQNRVIPWQLSPWGRSQCCLGVVFTVVELAQDVSAPGAERMIQFQQSLICSDRWSHSFQWGANAVRAVSAGSKWAQPSLVRAHSLWAEGPRRGEKRAPTPSPTTTGAHWSWLCSCANHPTPCSPDRWRIQLLLNTISLEIMTFVFHSIQKVFIHFILWWMTN